MPSCPPFSDSLLCLHYFPLDKGFACAKECKLTSSLDAFPVSYPYFAFLAEVPLFLPDHCRR